MTTFRKYEAIETPIPTTESYREGLIDGLQAAIDDTEGSRAPPDKKQSSWDAWIIKGFAPPS